MSIESPRTLIAEDNWALAQVLRFNLEADGHKVDVVTNGLEAIDALAQGGHELLVVDYQMPGADGAAVIRAAREQLGLKDLHIVLCTAKGLELDRDALTDQWNLAKVLFKPFSVRELLACVRTAFEARRVAAEACSAEGN